MSAHQDRTASVQPKTAEKVMVWLAKQNSSRQKSPPTDVSTAQSGGVLAPIPILTPPRTQSMSATGGAGETGSPTQPPPPQQQPQPVNLVTLTKSVVEVKKPILNSPAHSSAGAMSTPLRIPTITPQLRPAIIPPRTGVAAPPSGVPTAPAGVNVSGMVSHGLVGSTATVTLPLATTISQSTTAMPMVHSLGHHRLPASITPIPRAPTPVKSVGSLTGVMPQVSAATLALVQAANSDGGGSKLAVVQSPHNLTVGHNPHSLAVALRASGMPLKPQTPGNPVQFMPMRGSAAVTATIRQTIPFKTGGGVGVRTPMSSDHAVRVTLVSSANAISQAPPTSQAYFKPVTITSQPARPQLSPMTSHNPLTVRIGQPTSSTRMNMIPSTHHNPTGHLNVSLNPVVAGPMAGANNSAAQMARLLTPGGGNPNSARLLVPSSSVSISPSGVSIQKASNLPSNVIATGKTITLPKTNPNAIPVARVVPQNLVIASQLNVPETSIVLTSVPPQQQQQQLQQQQQQQLLQQQPVQLDHAPRGRPILMSHVGPNLTIRPTGTTNSVSSGTNEQPSQDKGTSSKPGILRRRDPDRDAHHEQDDNDGGSTSGSTTLSATSSPCDNTANNNESVALAFKIKKPEISLINSYRHTWRSRNNHFLRYTDVKPKDEKHPTVNELANQRYITQKLDGWKVYLLSGEMERVTDMEQELSDKLHQVQKRLEKGLHKEMSKEFNKVQELLKANLQRSRVFQEQVKETTSNAKQIFGHKQQVLGIVKKYESKRHIRKREFR
ncbi:histone deacetylase complex subunit SAP130-A-like isoform X2 [Tigriopus californicus]|uniref:histone deacetylase complex subunit SAP130-A-like isoform X2 n=1 Tax=Tigriopus californicus TaxID=6832 RepID=UPI0027D9FE82|nr:histone deacetylase complex subunit SAP130-A-like isoform X2 [Tigriopus californicus]